MSIDQTEFRRVLSHFASGVTVITFCDNDRCHGITVSSFCSLSLDPPLILICIDKKVASHDLIAQAGYFAVNILAEDGVQLSRRFATRADHKFADVACHTAETGAPLLDQALATIECRVVDQHPGGDHTIFIGEVLALAVRDDAAPLLYYRSNYHHLS